MSSISLAEINESNKLQLYDISTTKVFVRYKQFVFVSVCYVCNKTGTSSYLVSCYVLVYCVISKSVCLPSLQPVTLDLIMALQSRKLSRRLSLVTDRLHEPIPSGTDGHTSTQCCLQGPPALHQRLICCFKCFNPVSFLSRAPSPSHYISTCLHG